MADEVDPRVEADAQIARALQIVCDACDSDDQPKRDYTPDELETLFFALSMAMIQLAKVPGGFEAKERFYHGAKAELLKRDGRTVNLDRRKRAHDLIKKALGDNVDLKPGTTGAAMAKVVELELENLDGLREKIAMLAESMTLR